MPYCVTISLTVKDFPREAIMTYMMYQVPWPGVKSQMVSGEVYWYRSIGYDGLTGVRRNY